MRLKLDKENDALYFRLDETPIVESEELQTGVILDFDGNGHVIGVEILAVSKWIAPEQLRIIQFETV